LVSCDNGGDDPEPTTIKFTTSTATFEGDAINPVPSYTLTVTFDSAGKPTTYSASGSSRLTPTPGNSGTWSISGTVITFSDSGGAQREVNGSINSSSNSVVLDYNITKLDEGVITDEVGNYKYNMNAQ
jgi:hypothetical protein